MDARTSAPVRQRRDQGGVQGRLLGAIAGRRWQHGAAGGEAMSGFREYASRCPHMRTVAVQRRPGNALNVEIGEPQPRCLLNVPDNWPKEMTASRWIMSGGEILIFGTCKASSCPLRPSHCDRCGHRLENHVDGHCRVDCGGWPCGCSHEVDRGPSGICSDCDGWGSKSYPNAQYGPCGTCNGTGAVSVPGVGE